MDKEYVSGLVTPASIGEMPESANEAVFVECMAGKSFKGQPELREIWTIYKKFPAGKERTKFAEDCISHWNDLLAGNRPTRNKYWYRYVTIPRVGTPSGALPVRTTEVKHG